MDINIQLSETKIRFIAQDESGNFKRADFKAPWFSKFVAPNLTEPIQITCLRDVLLQSLPETDFEEVEMNVEVENEQEGHILILTTKSMFNVESVVPFTIDTEIDGEEYNFAEDKLLLSSNRANLPLQKIFRKNIKAEMLELTFGPQQLRFTGRENKN